MSNQEEGREVDRAESRGRQYLLEKANVVGTPGSGFGPHGEGYFRLTAFGTYENTVAAVERMKAL